MVLPARTTLVLGLILGCGARDALDVDGTPSTSSGSAAGAGATGGGGEAPGGAGGGGSAPLPRDIELEITTCDGCLINDLLVIVSAPDGSRRAVYSGTELPLEATVIDGDLVTFMQDRLSEPGWRAHSFRVRPDVARIKTAVPYEDFSCEFVGHCCDEAEMGEPMSLELSTAVVPGSPVSVTLVPQGPSNAGLSLSGGQATFTVSACPDAVVRLRATRYADASYTQLTALESHDVAYQPGGTISLDLGLDMLPRLSAVFNLTGLGDAVGVSGAEAWDARDYNFNPIHDSESLSSMDSLSWEGRPIDAPFGVSSARISAGFPDVSAWSSQFSARQYGALGTLTFDATAFPALTETSGGSWSLGPGTRGSTVIQVYSFGGDPLWLVYDDPNAVATAPVFPDIEGLGSAPIFDTQPSDPTSRGLEHHLWLEVPTYAAFTSEGVPASGTQVSWVRQTIE